MFFFGEGGNLLHDIYPPLQPSARNKEYHVHEANHVVQIYRVRFLVVLET